MRLHFCRYIRVFRHVFYYTEPFYKLDTHTHTSSSTERNAQTNAVVRCCDAVCGAVRCGAAAMRCCDAVLRSTWPRSCTWIRSVRGLCFGRRRRCDVCVFECVWVFLGMCLGVLGFVCGSTNRIGRTSRRSSPRKCAPWNRCRARG